MASVPHVLSFGLHPHIPRSKTQTLRVEQGTTVERPLVVRPAVDLMASMKATAADSAATAALEWKGVELRDVPEFVAKAGLTLTFSAWYEESVAESRLETARVRQVYIIHYLEDGSTAVVEPPVENSGLPQRKVLQRHKVPTFATDPAARFVTLPGVKPTEFLGWKDFKVGTCLHLYGKAYMIDGCTPHTRSWYEEEDARLAKAGLAAEGTYLQPADVGKPTDGYTEERAATMMRETGIDQTLYRGRKMSSVKRFVEASRGNSSAVITRGIKDKTAQWREHDSRECLTFYGLLDESDKMGGASIRLRVRYFLCDDTVELIEIRKPNDGRDRFSCLWKRARLPRDLIFHDSRSRDIESDKGDEDYYTVDDLCVGGWLNVLGRKVWLFDAEAGTYAWVLEHRGVDMTPHRVTSVDEVVEPTVVTPPPYLGFGTEEDSLGSFFSLQMRKPRKERGKLDYTLRYLAKFAAPKTVPDMDRAFTITLFTLSDSLAVYEPPRKNSGVLGGKFLAKTRLRNPDTGKFFEWTDFGVGKTVNINGFQFLVTGVDGGTEADLVKLRAEVEGRGGSGGAGGVEGEAGAASPTGTAIGGAGGLASTTGAAK